MDRKRLIVGIIILILIFSMVLPIFAQVFASGEESVEVTNGKEEKRIPPLVFIGLGIILLIVSFVLKKRDDKRPKDPMEDVELLEDYKNQNRKDIFKDRK